MQLADVYAVTAWYLKHGEEIQAYLARRDREAEEVSNRIEARQPPRPDLRAELLAQRARVEQGHAVACGGMW